MAIDPNTKLCVDLCAVKDGEPPYQLLSPEAYRMGVAGMPHLAYAYPEFQQRRDAARFLAVLEKRGLATVGASEAMSPEEVDQLIAEEVTRW